MQLLEARYPDIQQRGGGRAVFLSVAKGERAVAISIAEEGWLVELWCADEEHPGEEILVREDILDGTVDVVRRVSDWLE